MSVDLNAFTEVASGIKDATEISADTGAEASEVKAKPGLAL
jgi:hypothetical protein